MTAASLVDSTPDAPWLPAGSTAEVWAGAGCPVPDPCIIVRLLLTRVQDGTPQLFCTDSPKGPDLPTLFLGRGADRLSAQAGLDRLMDEVLGEQVPLQCVGYVRNRVPEPDESYPHPVPDAFVPVFSPSASSGADSSRSAAAPEPVADGQWLTLAEGREQLTTRHWWPIAEQALTTSPA